MKRGGLGVLRGVANALFPPDCMVCAQPVADAQLLCVSCWGEAYLISGTTCDMCGIQMGLTLRAGDTIRCDRCLSSAFSWDHGRAAAIYAGSARALVLALKHGDRPDIALALGRWMSRAASDVIAEADAILPIPLHWRRFLTRRYNQSAELSRVIAAEAGKPHAPDLLRRMRPTEMQRARSVTARAQNVKGAFVVPAHMRDAVKGMHIALVDDVMTTGATLNEAAKALRGAGATRISVVVFARVQPSTEF